MTTCRQLPLLIAVLALSAVPLSAATDDPFRCGNDIITLGDTMYEVRNSCGEPVSAQVVGETRKYRILKQKRYKIESTVYLSEWIYESEDGIYALTFEGSRLVEKEFIFR